MKQRAAEIISRNDGTITLAAGESMPSNAIGSPRTHRHDRAQGCARSEGPGDVRAPDRAALVLVSP